MSMVTLSWTAHTGYHLWEPQQNITNPDLTDDDPVDQVQDTNVKARTGKVVPHHNLIFTDITVQVIMTHTEATPGHDIGIITATPGVAHNTNIPHIEITVINPTTTHHTNLIADHPHIEVPQLTTPEIIGDHIHLHPTNPIDTATPGVAHNTNIPHIDITVINPTTTDHTNLIANHPHIGVPQLTTPEIIGDHIHLHPTNPMDRCHICYTNTPADHEANHTTRRTQE